MCEPCFVWTLITRPDVIKDIHHRNVYAGIFVDQHLQAIIERERGKGNHGRKLSLSDQIRQYLFDMGWLQARSPLTHHT